VYSVKLECFRWGVYAIVVLVYFFELTFFVCVWRWSCDFSHGSKW